MFVGIQDGKVISVRQTREELENMPCVVFDEIKETTENYLLNEKNEYTINGVTTYSVEEAREKRNSLITSILWRVERYNQQKQLGINTTDSEEEFMQILKYIQYLRDLPASLSFPNVEIMSFEQYVKQTTKES